MTDKVVLVTGGTRGLGLSICARLKKSGFYVIAAGRKPTSDLISIADKDVSPCSGTISYEQLDLANRKDIKKRVLEISAKHGNFYGLVNNAAIAHDGVLATMHEREIEEIIAVNVIGTILLTKYAIRSMLLGGGGRIINIASIIASTGFTGLSVYAASKSAMLGLTRSLARELGTAAITVNSVSPGYMQTDMTSSLNEKQLVKIKRRSALGRLVETSDVASAVNFLLSDEAAAITGINLTVDAGSTS